LGQRRQHKKAQHTIHHTEIIMAELSTQGVVREILTGNPEMEANEVIRRAKLKGLRASDDQIRKSVHNLRTSVRATVAAASKAAPAAARETTPPKAAPVVSAPAPATAAATPALGDVLANVALVNKIVGLCGGVENARQSAGAVQACGGVEEFLKHLELVATIRTAE